MAFGFVEDFWELNIPGINITVGAIIIAIVVTLITYVVLMRVALKRSKGK